MVDVRRLIDDRYRYFNVSITSVTVDIDHVNHEWFLCVHHQTALFKWTVKSVLIRSVAPNCSVLSDFSQGAGVSTFTIIYRQKLQVYCQSTRYIAIFDRWELEDQDHRRSLIVVRAICLVQNLFEHTNIACCVDICEKYWKKREIQIYFIHLISYFSSNLSNFCLFSEDALAAHQSWIAVQCTWALLDIKCLIPFIS